MSNHYNPKNQKQSKPGHANQPNQPSQSTQIAVAEAGLLINIRNWIGKNALYLAFIQALVAFSGSMYFSNIAGYPPCTLCWWQRIFFFPLGITLIVGILRRDKNVYHYILPPAFIGWAIAIYHNLLYYKIIPDTLAPCTTGVSCTTKFIEFFGFVTIPFLSFMAFSVIIILMFEYKRFTKLYK